MKSRNTFYRNADGVEIDEDEAFERGVLRDGVTLSVPTSMRDSMRDSDSLKHRAANDSRIRVKDAFGGEAGRRPGFAFTEDQATCDAKRQAYKDYDARKTNEWRDQGEDDPDIDEFFGSGEFIGAQAGDACTVRGAAFPLAQGAPGHLREFDGKLVCVPDSMDYDATDDSQRDAKDAKSVNDMARDHRKRMSDVYRKYDQTLSRSYREG